MSELAILLRKTTVRLPPHYLFILSNQYSYPFLPIAKDPLPSMLSLMTSSKICRQKEAQFRNPNASLLYADRVMLDMRWVVIPLEVIAAVLHLPVLAPVPQTTLITTLIATLKLTRKANGQEVINSC